MKLFFAEHADTPLVVRRLGYHQFEIRDGIADIDDPELLAAAQAAGGKPAAKEPPKKAVKKEVDDAS